MVKSLENDQVFRSTGRKKNGKETKQITKELSDHTNYEKKYRPPIQKEEKKTENQKKPKYQNPKLKIQMMFSNVQVNTHKKKTNKRNNTKQ